MQKQRNFWPFLLFSALLALACACGSSSPQSTISNTASPPPTVPARESLYVLDGTGNRGEEQRIIAFHPGSPGTTQITLPAGLFSQDHKHLYVATPQNGRTTILVINTLTGATLRTFAIPGMYSTDGQGYTTSVLSTDGKWLALRPSGPTNSLEDIALIDTQAGKQVKTIRLSSNFYLDAIAPNGDYLYLLEYLAHQGGRYYVRAYDVDKNQLIEQIIADKSELDDPRMVGSALTRQMAKDGKTAYTLYIDTGRNIAFIHALPLTQDGDINPPYLARCLDLPVGKSGNLLHYYTMVLSADGRTLYAANSALGVIVQLSLADLIFNIQISKVTFHPGDVNTANTIDPSLYNGASLSPDQSMLYFVGVHGIWSFSTADINTGTLHIQGNYLADQTFTSIAMSNNGQTLYAVHPDRGLTLFNVTSGQSLQVTQSPTRVPRGIVWVA
jgi:DNA-binding beta-propeller fold protein YncE